jgi:cyclopropane fatty-acyl-phospholipid synthase-like methyltransferase
MNINKEQLAEMLKNERFPLSSKYAPEWVVENQMGPTALWLTEWLCEEMDLRPGMRVLDMGCGRAMSSIFLAKELDVLVWANDLWISATDNWKRIREAGVEDRVFPIHAEAHSLPYAEGFFDAVVSVDSYHYYGTDDLYLSYFAKFAKPGGQIGIVVPGLMQDFDGKVPEHLARKQKSGGTFWDPKECFSFHTADWWRRHWNQTRLVDIVLADTLPDGWKHWLQFAKAIDYAKTNTFPSDVETLEADSGRYIGFVRMVARRKETE